MQVKILGNIIDASAEAKMLESYLNWSTDLL